MIRYITLTLIFINSITAIEIEKISKSIIDNIKIGIIENVKEIEIQPKDAFLLFDNKNKLVTELSSADILIIRTKKSRLEITKDQKVIGSYELIDLLPRQKNAHIRCGEKIYKNNIKILINNNKLITVINTLNLDEYLKGVVPKEIGPKAHIEALKSQAVCARTSALFSLGKHLSDGYDLCSTVCCQVYGGVSAEHQNTSRAVTETIGELLVHNGKIIRASYHACCGGYTEDKTTVWGGDELAYLVPVPCFSKDKNREYRFPLSNEENFKKWITGSPESYCKDYPKFRWRKLIKKEHIQKRVKREIGKLLRIGLGERGPGGKLKYIELIGTKGRKKIEGEYKIRSFFGGVFFFYSGSFIVEEKGDAYEFIGSGWGHGVGLCQAGACSMAENFKMNYKQILQHYYPNTTIKKIY